MKQNKTAHGNTAMIYNKLPEEQVNGACTVRSEAEHRCTFDMHHRYTINIFGLGWRAHLSSIVCDCNRWSTPFLQNIPTPPQVSSFHPRTPPTPPSLNNQQQQWPCTRPHPHHILWLLERTPFFLCLIHFTPPRSRLPLEGPHPPITQHLQGSHWDKIRPSCSSLSPRQWSWETREGSGRTKREKEGGDVGNSWQLFQSESNLLFQVPYLQKRRMEKKMESVFILRQEKKRQRSFRKFRGLIWHNVGRRKKKKGGKCFLCQSNCFKPV